MRAHTTKPSRINSLEQDLAHIIDSISDDNGDKIIHFSKNADKNLIKNFQAALGTKEDSIIHPDYPDQIIVKAKILRDFKSKSGTELNDFYQRFINLQKSSMLEAIRDNPHLNKYVIDDKQDGAIILEKSTKMSSRSNFNNNNALAIYRDEILCSSKTEKAEIARGHHFGPKYFKQLYKSLAITMQGKRGVSRDMFNRGIIAVEPVDIIFFNKDKFKKHFPNILVSEQKKTPEQLIDPNFAKPTRPLMMSSPPLLLVSLVLLLVQSIIYVLTSPIARITNATHKKIKSESSSYKDPHNKKLDNKKAVVTRSARKTLTQIESALNLDIAPLKSSPLDGHLSTLIMRTHDQFQHNTLSHRSARRYQLSDRHMKTTFDTQNNPTHTKGLTVRQNVIEFYGQTQHEAREVILHELMHVISHDIEHLGKEKYKSDYKPLLEQSGKWLKQFCLDHSIEFEIFNTIHIRGTIVQDADYHSNDGMGYIANLIPKLLQVRALDEKAFDTEVKRPGNPVAKLFDQLNHDSEAILSRNKDAIIGR